MWELHPSKKVMQHCFDRHGFIFVMLDINGFIFVMLDINGIMPFQLMPYL